MSHLNKGRDERPFTPWLFVINNLLLFAGLMSLLWVCLPRAVWNVQLPWKDGSSVWKFVAAFFIMKLINSFIEYFFHRYVLHKPVVPFLSYFYRQHTLHHGLTSIDKRKTLLGHEILYIVENSYPITEPQQAEASFFPWYTLVVFCGIITPFVMFLQWLMPAFPWFTASYSALLASLFLYEIVHAIEHLSPEKWDKLLYHPQFGRFWRKAYSFHLRHHAVIDCNESISGFATIPIPDIIFGTIVMPKTLYIDGSFNPEDSEFKSPSPRWPISQLDKGAVWLIRKRRERIQLRHARTSARRA